MKIGIIAAALAFVGLSAVAQTNQKTNMDMKKLELVQEWDKTFPKSDKVEHSKVVFVNRFGVTLAADMYVPKEVVGKLSAVAVSGPFGAVKEQSSGLYAQALAERGFLTIAFDPSFTGESGGVPRNVASPDINTEDFSAAVDFLANEDRVDPERIGILGICGWGGFAINAAANDTRIKVTVASTMYDISRCTANGYFDQADNADARYEMRRRLNAQRTEDYRNGSYVRAGGVVDPVPADAPQFVRDYHAYYKTSRGYHARSLNSTQGWNATSNLAFLNAPILAYAAEIRSAVMVVHGSFSLYGRGRFQEIARRQQTIAHRTRCQSYRPLRQDGDNPVRRNSSILSGVFEVSVALDRYNSKSLRSVRRLFIFRLRM